MSLRYVCRSVARIVGQASVLLIVCASDVSLKGGFRVRSGVQRSVAQKRRLHVCVCVFAQKCCSEVLITSIGQKYCSELSVRGVDQQCRIRRVAQKCCSEVSVESVAQ